jgi:site-specific DNA-methyltransferase (adenine-specific)
VKRLIRQAFEEVHQGYSADRVVADPGLNTSFITACRLLGIDLPIHELNSSLLNARKASLLTGIPTTSRTAFADLDEYQFASEIAARFLEHRSQVTLDQILCDPVLAEEFDKLATKITPGFTSLQYRWAALNLRKLKRLRPELLSHVVVPTSVQVSRIDELDLEKLPAEQGIYIFFSSKETLYVGECENFRVRIKKHLDHSDIRAVAHHFWQHGTGEVLLELRALPKSTSTRVRRALEAELIASRRATFNIKRS